ncbi:hypothetical protein [Jeotgalibacillus sp. R-1-5s-1]|uniref:hypothetical protein n=1 Tax=Jeotgalibacillus sp. R-1-5s-1 TaxID=2555897 RepID=UPI001069E505|nr:hypothetical protein [Jeotgalibacillus sp. R-1-5s-1]TFD93645.1 hypothetical protein E2491_14500 [Jeotgalibacillus sp. R-1-5s-1]
MSTKSRAEIGSNISNAVHVLQETYKNLNVLFSEMDRVGEEQGFISMTPRFLRWKSDSHSEGWLTSNFIKLYQKDDGIPLSHLPNMNNGDVFGIEVDLEGSENIPAISLVKYKFDYTSWTRTPSTSDHWVFWDPFRIDKFFKINKKDGQWFSETNEKGKEKYWGLEKAVAIEIPLLEVNSPEDISEKIFEGFGVLFI